MQRRAFAMDLGIRQPPRSMSGMPPARLAPVRTAPRQLRNLLRAHRGDPDGPQDAALLQLIAAAHALEIARAMLWDTERPGHGALAIFVRDQPWDADVGAITKYTTLGENGSQREWHIPKGDLKNRATSCLGHRIDDLEEVTTMHTDVDQFEYGDFRFIVELDTGSETGSEQLTVWYAERLDAASLPLASFSMQQLLAALQEPERTQVVQEWEQARVAITQEFNKAREALRRPFRNPKGRIEQLPEQVQRQLGDLRHQEKKANQGLERQFRNKVLQFERQRFDQSKLSGNKRFGEPRYLRDFYFDETNRRYMDNFCRKFAFDAPYRDDVLSGHAHWVERNALFVRNLRGQCTRSRNGLFSLECARAFFKWVCSYAATIIQLPEYQQLQALDNQFLPQHDQLDPGIKEAVELLNQVPGIQTKFSCQGVSGTVSFQGRTLLAVSAHEEQGYVTFASLAVKEQEGIMQFLPGFPALELRGPPESVFWELRSSGDNLAFRSELSTLARQLQKNS